MSVVSQWYVLCIGLCYVPHGQLLRVAASYLKEQAPGEYLIVYHERWNQCICHSLSDVSYGYPHRSTAACN